MNNELEQYQNVRVQTDRQTDRQTHVSASQLASVGLAQARPNYCCTLPAWLCDYCCTPPAYRDPLSQPVYLSVT